VSRLILLLWAALSLGLTGCGTADEPVHRQQFFAFGTLVDVSLYGVTQSEGEQAVRAVEDMFRQDHHLWHAWEPGPLQQLNQAIAAGEPSRAPDSIIDLLKKAQALETSSRGLFNPAIGGLLKAWKFQQDEPGADGAPDREAMQAVAAQHPSTLQLTLAGNRVTSSNPAVQLDFGGFAKGYAIGQAIALINARGIDNAVVNAGGDLCVSGRHGRRPWRIGIRDPRGDGVLASIELAGRDCVFTSGDYERYYEQDGQRVHHILDPRTGRPAQGTRSVTVIDNDPTLADAAATALFIAGPGGWHDIARSMGIRCVLLIDAQGVAHMTPAMAGRVRFTRTDVPVQLSAPLP